MRYFIHASGATAVAEADESAARLQARGYIECGAAVHAAVWAGRNTERLAQLRIEDARAAIQRMSYAERVRRGI